MIRTLEFEHDYLVNNIHVLESAGVDKKNTCIVAKEYKLLDNYNDGLHRVGIKSFEIKVNKTDDDLLKK